MEDADGFVNGIFENSEFEEEFISCCAEDEEWQDAEQSLDNYLNKELEECSIRMFFKGFSVSDTWVSGIGVVMERSPGLPIIQVQKKLEFYVEELVAEHLALMDGLLEALKHGVQKVYAYTDCEEVYYQIAEAELLNDQLSVALGLRILELADKLEVFELKLIPSSDIVRPLQLAQEAIGIFEPSSNADGVVEDFPFCCEEKQQKQIVKFSCSSEADVLQLDTIYCPYPNCSMLLNSSHYLSCTGSSSNQDDISCIECPECHRLICISCGVPWHSSMTCREYQTLPAEERDTDVILHQLAQNNNWAHCRRCRQMIELTQGCHHMTCWCGHQFYHSCGAEYREGIQTCQCAYWDEENLPPVEFLNREPEPRRWESFDPLTAMDAYSEQERAQLALVQRFLSEDLGLGDLHPCHSPPRCSDSYADTMRELHQLPWLENFISVISDNPLDVVHS